GAGTMGARIAAHFANAGVPCLLLDVARNDVAGNDVAGGGVAGGNVGGKSADRSPAGRAGLGAGKEGKPAGLGGPRGGDMVTAGNFGDDIAKLSEADWIVEAVVENLEVKRELLKKVEQTRRPGTIVSTNTSGLPVEKIAEGLSDEFRRHWLGTHFFNPPR